jgi:hypothetical protein
MNERESDPTGAFRGGSAGLEPDTETGTEYERHAPESSDPGGGQPNTGESGDATGGTNRGQTPGVDEAERQAITSGVAATSEVADPEAQRDAEAQGDGTPLPS